MMTAQLSQLCKRQTKNKVNNKNNKRLNVGSLQHLNERTKQSAVQAVTASMCHLPSKTMWYLFLLPPTVSVLLNSLAPFSPLIQRGLPRQAQA